MTRSQQLCQLQVQPTALSHWHVLFDRALQHDSYICAHWPHLVMMSSSDLAIMLQDAMRSFLGAMGSVAPFTWLERGTRDPAPPPPPSAAQQARSLARDTSHAAGSMVHRCVRARACACACACARVRV